MNPSKKILLVTFSDNSDMQDMLFGMYEELKNKQNTYLLAIKDPKVPFKKDSHTWLIDCPKRPGITKKTFDLKMIFSIIRKIKGEKFDVIYFESLHVWNLPIMCFSGVTHTYQVIHDVIPHKGDRQTTAVKLMNKLVVRMADTIVLRNERFIQYMVDHYNIKPQRIEFLRLWRRFPSYTPPSQSGKILFFGRINPYKGIDNLINIVRLCPTLHFNIVGRVDPQMLNSISILKKESNVFVKDGYITDYEMETFFSDSDWVILPYNSASQSGIIVDAYKYSRPVIAFSVGAITEQIEDGVTGYLIDEGNNRLFADKLNHIASMSSDEHTMMCKNAYNYGINKYSVKEVASSFLTIIGA